MNCKDTFASTQTSCQHIIQRQSRICSSQLSVTVSDWFWPCIYSLRASIEQSALIYIYIKWGLNEKWRSIHKKSGTWKCKCCLVRQKRVFTWQNFDLGVCQLKEKPEYSCKPVSLTQVILWMNGEGFLYSPGWSSWVNQDSLAACQVKREDGRPFSMTLKLSKLAIFLLSYLS